MRKHVIFILLGLCVLAACASAPSSQPAAPSTAAPPAVQADAPASTSADPAPPDPAPTNPPPASGGDANLAVVAALVAQVQGGPYRVATVVESVDGTSQVNSEFVPPDRFHSTGEQDGTTMDLIIIGADMWRKTAQSWVRSAAPESVMRLNTAEGVASAVSAATFVGADTLDGTPVLVYAYTNTIGAGDQADSSANTLWVSAESGLPLRIQGISAFGSTSYTTTQTIVYDASITIEAPQ